MNSIAQIGQVIQEIETAANELDDDQQNEPDSDSTDYIIERPTPLLLQQAQPERPNYEPTDYTKELNELNISVPKALTPQVPGCADSVSNDLDTTVTLDLMDFDSIFACPLCKLAGDETMLTLFSLSDHITKHKYDTMLAEKHVQREKQADSIKFDNPSKTTTYSDRRSINAIKDMIPGYGRSIKAIHEKYVGNSRNEQLVSDYRLAHDLCYDEDDDEDEDEHIHHVFVDPNIFRSNVRNEMKQTHHQSTIETEFMGGMNEDDALAAAIAASTIESSNDKKQNKHVRIEADDIEIDCD